MLKHLRKCMWLLCLLFSATLFAQTVSVDPVRGALRVKLQEEVATQFSARPFSTQNGIVATGITPFDNANQQVRAYSMSRVFPYSAKVEDKIRKYGLHLWYEIKFDENISPVEARQIFSKIPGVTIAENPIPLVSPDDKRKATYLNETEIRMMNTRSTSTMPFNDPLLPKQWHYQNYGNIDGSVAGADINLFEAWKTATGNKDLIIAIIDGGIDYKHVDLAENMLVNETELKGIPGIDNDGNGYEGDIYGYNCVTKSGEIYPHDHGTHVAGTVAAVNNNGIGVAGVAGGNGQGGVKMISCQVFDSRTSSSDSDFALAFHYALVRGATIAQCSWGWSSPDYYAQVVLDAINAFTAEASNEFMKGGLAIFANGNMGKEGKYYPASYDKVLAVGSMTYNLKYAPYSNYGDWCDITAPGGYIETSNEQGVLSTLPGDSYGYMDGTSMACPHVAGVAALILSKYGNPDFTNETLRQQLISSVKDFYVINPEMKGKFGSGYLDANKALQMGEGNAPSPIKDFKLMPSQDNILVEWTIPSADDNNVNNHLLYYSTAPFSETDLKNIPYKRVDTKFYYSGDVTSYELDNLEPLTTYYIALLPVDRWGNMSTLSVVKSATTNAGPKMALSKKNLTININAQNSLTGSDKFVITNEDEGLLKWKHTTHTTSMTPNSANTTLEPNAGVIAPASSNVSSVPFSTVPTIPAEYMADDFPAKIEHHTMLGAYIGETDLTLTNSQAQWFYVNPTIYPDGFNLTHLRFLGSGGKNSKIEIVNGREPISKGTVYLSQTMDNFYYNYDIKLDEQLYFAPGDVFWVVNHFPKGQVNPCGVGIAKEQYLTTYSYYSSDMGQTWTMLSDVIRNSNLSDMADESVWGITAISKNPDWSSVLTLNPTEGSIRSNEQQEVEVSNAETSLVNGKYSLRINLSTNESGNKSQDVNVSLNVSGNTPALQTAKMVNFGDLLVGQSKELSVEIVNKGYGSFKGKWGGLDSNNMTCSSDQFAVDTYHPGIASRSKSTINVTFKPTKAGSHSGTVKLVDKDGISHTFIVRGIADDPAKIEVTPSTIELGDIEIDSEAREAKFTISNKGQYPLEYVFPKFSNEQLDNAGKSSHKFGYTYISNLNGSTDFAYNSNLELIGAIDITNQLGDKNVWSKPIDLGFSFDYYGTTYSELYVSAYGGLSISTDGYINSCVVPVANSVCIRNLGFISAYGGCKLSFGNDSKVEYAKQDGKFIVKYTNARAYSSEYQKYMSVSFRITLDSRGDIEMFYDDYDPSIAFNYGANLFVGINDLPVKDPLTVTDCDSSDTNLYNSFGTGSAVKFIAPSKNMIEGLSHTNGVIGIGESQEITAIVVAKEGHYAGELINSLAIESNDPENGVSYVSFRANIVGESLKPIASLDSETIDFGNVLRTSDVKQPVTIKNLGTSILEVTGLSLKNNKFVISQETPFEVKPGNSKDIITTLPTVIEGAVEDEITIEMADGTTLVAQLKGNVIGVPEIETDVTSFDITTPSGTNVFKTIEVSNKGNEILEYSVLPNSFVNLLNNDTDENSSMSYSVLTSAESADVEFSWEDIETNGLGELKRFAYYYDNDFLEVDLPFEFMFYGKKYSKMYLYGVGFISFSHVEDMKELPNPPLEIPSNMTLYSNFIAPLWAYHFMDDNPTAGIYYHANEERAVVSFMEYGNTMNYGLCFQAILYKSGKIKFQYKLLNENSYFNNMFGVSGIQNQDATEGIDLSESCVVMNQSVEFYPVKKEQIEPNTTKSLELEILADKMAGTYETAVQVQTNIPTNPLVEIPVNLTITGEAKPVYPTEISEELVMGSTNGSMGVYEIPFRFANEGTANYTITNIEIEGFTDWSMTYGQLWYYGEHYDDWFGTTTIGFGNYFEGTKITIGKDPLDFKIMLMAYYMPMEINVAMKFTVEGLDVSTIIIPLKITVTDMPAIGFDKEEIRFSNVANNYVGESEFTINSVGQYKLSYSLQLDASGTGFTPAEDDDYNGSISPASIEKVVLPEAKIKALSSSLQPTSVSRSINIDEPIGLDFRNSLYHPIKADDFALFMFGANNKYSEYQAATLFTAPAEGFNLHSVYFLGSIGNLKNVEVKVEVIQGNNIANGEVIGTGKLFIESEEVGGQGVYNGEFRLIELDKPVYLNPNENFYVNIIYPVGYEYPAGLVKKEDVVVANRYMGWFDGDGWIDIASNLETSYGSLGYITTCIEMEEGTPWIKLLTDETSGVINVGESKTVKVGVNAAAARHDKSNKSVVIVKSNDLMTPFVNYPIYLDKNIAPVITTPSGLIYAKEGEKTLISIDLEDLEVESFTVSVASQDIPVVIESINGDADVTTEITEDNTAKVNVNEEATQAKAVAIVAITPDYGTAGKQSFTISTKDASGNMATKEVVYYVQYVNRAPNAHTQSDIELGVKATSDIIEYANLFTDPDGDDMTYALSLSNTGIVDAYTSQESVIFVGRTVGESTVTVTATDSKGAATKNTFKVNVVAGTGINDAELSNAISVYPNPVVDNANVTINTDVVGDVEYRLYNASGAMMYDESARVAPREVHTIGMNGFVSGIYYLELTIDGAKVTVPIMKK